MPTRSSAASTRRLRSAAGMRRYVSGNSTFSYTFKSPMRLNAWKMKPISRLRMRARSAGPSDSIDSPASEYWPLVGASSRPRIESSVDLPHLEGPAIETYSPRLISRCTPFSACVSNSSVKKTLLTPSSRMSDSSMCLPLLERDVVVAIELRDVGDDDAVAGLQSFADFDVGGRGAAEGDGDFVGGVSVCGDFENGCGRVLGRSHRTADVKRVGNAVELHDGVDGKVGTRAGGKRTIDAEIDGDRAFAHGGIDARYDGVDDAVARVDRGALPDCDVFRLRLRNANLGFESVRPRDARQIRAGRDALSGLHANLLQDAIDSGAHVQRLGLLPPQRGERTPLLDLRLQRGETQSLRFAHDAQPLIFESNSFGVLIGGALRQLFGDVRGQSVALQVGID